MAEYANLRAKIKIPEVGTTDWFTYNKGAKQGGVETPDIWKIVLDYLFDPIISTWKDKNWGFKVKMRMETQSQSSHTGSSQTMCSSFQTPSRPSRT